MVVLGQIWLYSGKSCCSRAKEVVFGQKRLYSGIMVVFGKSDCIKAKVVVFGQKRLYSEKGVVLEQQFC